MTIASRCPRLKAVVLRAVGEPTVQFALLGVMCFAMQAFARADHAGDSRRIVFDAAQIDEIRHEASDLYGRPPTDDEERLLLRQRTEHEVLYREALALGLDKDDIVIKRRLIQKMDLLVSDLDAPPEPTEADLHVYLASHLGDYREPARITFEQVFLNADLRHTIDHDARALLERLVSDGRTPATGGDPFVLGERFVHRTRQEIEAVFGLELAETLFQQRTGAWIGPLRSTYGVHLVHIERIDAPRNPRLAEVRARIRFDLLELRRKQKNQVGIDRLLRRYTVLVEDAKLAAALRTVP